MGKQAPATPDYSGAAASQAASSQANTAQQTSANRSNQDTGFASSGWSYDPNTGQWSQSEQLNGPLSGAMNEAGQQYQKNLGTALDDGSATRDKTISRIYGSESSLMDPQFRQQQESTNAQLANEGLDPNSEAARTAQNQLATQQGMERTQAMGEAEREGTAAGQAAFEQNLAAREAPLSELHGLHGLESMPGYNQAGRAESQQDLAASMAQGNYQLPAWQATNSANADMYGGIAQLLGSFIPFGMGGK